MALLFAAVDGRAEPPPPDLSAALLLRVLAFDRNLRDRAGEVLRIGVVEGGNVAEASATTHALTALAERVTVAGLRVQVLRHGYRDEESLAAFLRENAVSVICLSEGLGGLAGQLAAVAHRHRATLVAYDGESMADGCALGFTIENHRSRIVVDTDRARASGMDLEAGLLELVRTL